jgi:hypothetical protein
MADQNNNTNIALEQGGDAFFFYQERVSAESLKALLYKKTQVQIVANSAGRLSTISIPDVGFVIFSLATAASNASAWLGGCIAGEEKVLYFRTTGAVASVFISMDASVTLWGPIGLVSHIHAHGSAASNPVITLRGIADDTWAVVDTRGYVDLAAGA